MKDVNISSIFMPEFRFHSDVLLITFKKCQDSKESCREEDAVKKKRKGKKKQVHFEGRVTTLLGQTADFLLS